VETISTNNDEPKWATLFEPKDWFLESLVPWTDGTAAGSKFSFVYPTPGAIPVPNARLSAFRVVVEAFGDGQGTTTQVSMTFWINHYVWQMPDTDSLAILFQLSNTLNMTASITRPDRIQVAYSYISSPHFAQARLFNTSTSSSDIERVPVRFYAPPDDANNTYWIVYERFKTSLEHKTQLGYGLEPHPSLAAITGLTCFGIVLLSCCVVALIVFGRKIDKKYGRRFEQLGQ